MIAAPIPAEIVGLAVCKNNHLAKRVSYGWKCAECNKIYGKEYYQRNKARLNGRIRERYASDPQFRAKVTEYHRNYGRARFYGVYPETIAAMQAEQEGRCAICSKKPKRLVVDHNHSTGKIRALLCHCCNVGIGLFKENPGALAAAIRYLEKHT